MSSYDITNVHKQFSQKFLYKFGDSLNGQFGSDCVGFVPPKAVGQFFSDYHEYLKQCGVDGVKVDNQVFFLAFFEYEF